MSESSNINVRDFFEKKYGLKIFVSKAGKIICDDQKVQEGSFIVFSEKIKDCDKTI
jgi:hypothetical protein